jgi:hypothetical protein
VEAVTVENIVAEDQCNTIWTDEVAPDDEGLREPARTILCGKGEPYRSITQQPLEQRLTLRGRNDENVANASEHQHRQTGSSCLETTVVIGKRRLPLPPARTIPFICSA